MGIEEGWFKPVLSLELKITGSSGNIVLITLFKCYENTYR